MERSRLVYWVGKLLALREETYDPVKRDKIQNIVNRKLSSIKVSNDLFNNIMDEFLKNHNKRNDAR